MNMQATTAQAHQSYQRAQVESASPEKLILMLYDGAIRKLSQAEVRFEQGDEETFLVETTKVQKIVSELAGALDHEQGGEVSQNLARLYEYMVRQLSLAQVRKETKLLLEIRTLLEELREGWRGAIEKMTQSATADSKGAENVVRSKSFKIPEKALEGMVPTLNIAG
jgi:flagellar protein FliS